MFDSQITGLFVSDRDCAGLFELFHPLAADSPSNPFNFGWPDILASAARAEFGSILTIGKYEGCNLESSTTVVAFILEFYAIPSTSL